MPHRVIRRIYLQLGVFTKTLRYLANSDMRKWRKENEEYRKYAPKWLEIYFQRWEERPYRYSVGLLLVGLIYTISLPLINGQYPQIYLAIFQSSLIIATDPDKEVFNPNNLLTYFNALWGIQAAVMALVYPIVISFATILFQRQHGSDAYLEIYLNTSAARSSVARSLALVLLMGVQYLLLMFVGTHIKPEMPLYWLLLDGLFFLDNMASAAWFLHTTFASLSRSSHDRLVKRYTIGIAWPWEIFQNLENHIFANSTYLGLLPVKGFGDSEAKNEPQAVCLPLGMDEGSTEVSVLIKGSKQLVDVRFRFLAWAVNSWRKRAMKSIHLNQKDQTSSFQEPLITFPLVINSEYSGSAPLCVIRNSPSLTWSQRLLIKNSFCFQKMAMSESGVNITPSGMIEQLASELLHSIRSGHSQDFERARNSLVNLFTSLVKAGDFVTDSGQHDNYSKLSDATDFASSAFYKKWLMELRDPIKEAAEYCLTDSMILQSIAYIPYRLVGVLDHERHREIIIYSFGYWSLLCRFVIDRWARAIEEQGEIKHSHFEPVRLRPPFQGHYEKAVKGLLASWEAIPNYALYTPRNNSLDWKSLCASGLSYLPNHLNSLIGSFLYFVHAGDETGANRFLDGILNWLATYDTSNTAQYSRAEVQNYEAIELSLINQSWEHVKEKHLVDNSAFPQNAEPKTIFSIVMANYWRDISLTACCILLRWSVSKTEPATFVISLAKHLLGGSSPHEEDRQRRFPPIASADEIIYIMLRQRMGYSSESKSFTWLFDNLIDEALDLGKPEQMAGRIYISVGSNDIRSLGNELLLSLMYKACSGENGEQWHPSNRLLSLVSNQVATGSWDGEKLASLFEEWIGCIKNADFEKYRKPFLALAPELKEADFDSRRDAVTNGLASLLERSRGTRDQKIIEAQIDQDLLRNIGEWSSKSGFYPDSNLPLPFFNKIELVSANLEKNSLLITNANKARYTKPLLEDFPINEKEWFSRTVAGHVAGAALSKALRNTQFNIFSASSPEQYWRLVTQFATLPESSKYTPVLLSSGYSDPDWLWQWLSSYRIPEGVTRPEDMLVWRKERMPKEYRGNLNNVEVYSAPIRSGVSYLMMKESFDSIKFHEYEKPRYVDVAAEPVEGKPLLINLRLEWQMEVNVTPLPAMELRHSAQ